MYHVMPFYNAIQNSYSYENLKSKAKQIYAIPLCKVYDPHFIYLN